VDFHYSCVGLDEAQFSYKLIAACIPLNQVIVAWNGLAISAFARASRILLTEPPGVRYEFPVTGCHVIFSPSCSSFETCPLRVHLFSPEMSLF